ncbi:MAG: phosphate transport system regulatory protein PhoU [Desulfovibrionales bacterium]|nr:MAG: phosphate transport system regulatory protein PhoU [Desulfovibrionales bacterium]
MTTFFMNRLEELKISATSMAALCEKALDKAQRGYFQRDTSLAKEVMAGDEQINLLELEVDQAALKLLALDHPMAKDLRYIVGTMNIGLDLERIGDETYNIARRSLFLSGRPPLPYFPAMENLGQMSMDMLSGAIAAYLNGDAESALEICQQDEKASTETVKVIKALIDYMVNEAPAVERCVHSIFIARSLERISDLSTNIAESVLFITKGVNLKAGCRR